MPAIRTHTLHSTRNTPGWRGVAHHCPIVVVVTVIIRKICLFAIHGTSDTTINSNWNVTRHEEAKLYVCAVCIVTGAHILLHPALVADAHGVVRIAVVVLHGGGATFEIHVV